MTARSNGSSRRTSVVKTAIKTSLSRYVASQTVGFASQFNPLGGTITGGPFSGTGADTRVWTDPNADRIVQLSELGPTSNPNFGLAFLSTLPSADVQKGWFKRGYNWEYSANVQHELRPRVSIGAAYFRRWFGNFTHTDALGVGPADYTPYCITAPNDSRLPNSGEPVCGLFDVTSIARPLLSVSNPLSATLTNSGKLPLQVALGTPSDADFSIADTTCLEPLAVGAPHRAASRHVEPFRPSRSLRG